MIDHSASVKSKRASRPLQKALNHSAAASTSGLVQNLVHSVPRTTVLRNRPRLWRIQNDSRDVSSNQQFMPFVSPTKAGACTEPHGDSCSSHFPAGLLISSSRTLDNDRLFHGTGPPRSPTMGLAYLARPIAKRDDTLI